MTELAEKAALRIREYGPGSVADEEERVIATHHACAQSAAGSRFVIVSVVAMVFFKARQIFLGERQRMPVAGRGGIGKPGEVSTRQLLRMLDGEISHQRHAIVFELAEPQRSRLIAVMGRHGVEQVLPVRGERRRPLATHRRQILLSVLVVRHREYAPVCRQPFHLAGAVDPISLLRSSPQDRRGRTDAASSCTTSSGTSEPDTSTARMTRSTS